MNEKVNVAHLDENGQYKVISVNANAVATHLSHSDFLATNFETFYIRNNNSTITAPWDNDIVLSENPEGDGFTARTPRGGQKVGYGTSALDGIQINKLETVNWERVSGMSNGGLVSYLNIWVTDGNNYAVIASENNYLGTNFATRQEWKVFEYSGTNLNWLFDGGTGARDGSQYLTLDGTRVKLSQLSNRITIMSPQAPYPGYVGTGAPRGGYGFNLIWGDTQANFTAGTIPNQLKNLTYTVNGETYRAINF
ncbi:hypothetical protein GCM10027291_25190 [Telluribacter humicola]